MMHKVYSVYDQAAKAFLPPFCLRNDQQAIRTFKDCVNSPNHQFNAHPEDYSLYLMGEFNDALGEFTNEQPGPKNLGSGLAQLKVAASAAIQQQSLFVNGEAVNG